MADSLSMLRRRLDVAKANLRLVTERAAFGWTVVADRWRREIVQLRAEIERRRGGSHG